MKNLLGTFGVELIKLRRSKILLITVCLFIFIPLMMGLLMYLAQHPQMASKMGIVAAKASFFRENSWDGYFEIINQTVTAIGVIGFGFVTSWVFGREYIEHTITDLLALPVRRSSIVVAKFIVVLLWCSVLISVLFFSGLCMGLTIGIPGWTKEVFYHSMHIFFLTSYLTVLLSTPVAFIATASRGIIAPIGFVILMLIVAQLTAVVGWGPYFPWAIPGIFTVPPGTEGMQIVPSSYFVLVITSLAGFFGTIAWWCWADQG